MADIFLSYAREDLAKAQALASALEKQGWGVFWDRTSILTGQDFDEVIEQAIAQAGCMIVAWSNASKKSDWVRGEGSLGRERRILLPVLFELVEPPIAFRSLHTEDLSAWKGDASAPAFLALCNAIRNRLELRQFELNDPIAKQEPPNIPLQKPVVQKRLGQKIGKKMCGLAILIGLVAIGVYGTVKQQIAENPVDLLGDKTKPELKLPEMLSLTGGEFWMGSVDDDKNASSEEKPRHKVKVKAFAMGKYEVTKADFSAFTSDSGYQSSGCWVWNRSGWKDESSKSWRNPGFKQDDNEPVTCVSHDDANAYIRWLNNKTGSFYRLPTEAEWEYAARAGSAGDFYWGQDDPNGYAWYINNSEDKTHSVGTKKPNAFDLYDMSGNVWEWTCSAYTEMYEGSEIRCASGTAQRVIRGGSWSFVRNNLRLATRDGDAPYDRNNHIGFRLAQDLP